MYLGSNIVGATAHFYCENRHIALPISSGIVIANYHKTAQHSDTSGQAGGATKQLVHTPYIQIDTKIKIDCPQQEVFDYVTTATLWHTWHPATTEVRHAPARPLNMGETALEYIEVYGRRDQVLWTVVSCVAPEHWGIAADAQTGTASISYRFTTNGRGCYFHRTLRFRSKSLLWRLFDATLVRLLLERQSARALRKLKHILERRFSFPHPPSPPCEGLD